MVKAKTLSRNEIAVRKALVSYEERALASAYPILAEHDDGTSLIGSGFLLSFGTRFALVTAAHVLDTPHAKLLLPDMPWPIASVDAIRTGVDQFDLAILLLPPGVSPDGSRATPINPTDLDVDDTGNPSAIYSFAGFPQSKNRIHRGRVYNPHLTIHSGRAADSSAYLRLGRDHRSFLALRYNRTRALGRDLKPTMPAAPYGMSGGPVWRIGFGTEVIAGTAEPKIVGIAIEYHREHALVLAVRASVLVAILRAEVPAAARALPEPTYFRPTIRRKTPPN